MGKRRTVKRWLHDKDIIWDLGEHLTKRAEKRLEQGKFRVSEYSDAFNAYPAWEANTLISCTNPNLEFYADEMIDILMRSGSAQHARLISLINALNEKNERLIQYIKNQELGENKDDHYYELGETRIISGHSSDEEQKNRLELMETLAMINK